MSQKIFQHTMIRSDIEDEAEDLTPTAVDDQTISPQVTRSLSDFSMITIEDVEKRIKNMSNKFCSLDPIPTFLLKSCSDVLSPIILHIVNSSIRTAEFPADMKKAVIKPTLKKSDSDSDCL